MNQSELPVETESHAFHTGHAKVLAAMWRRKLLSRLLALRLGLKARFDGPKHSQVIVSGRNFHPGMLQV